MLEKELSIYDIRAIGGGRFDRKFTGKPVVWVLLVLIMVLVIGGLVIDVTMRPLPQYTLPSGEIVEVGKQMTIDDSIIIERDNPASFWSFGLGVMLIGAGIAIGLITYMFVQEYRARDKIMEEWLAAGYQPKATDV